MAPAGTTGVFRLTASRWMSGAAGLMYRDLDPDDVLDDPQARRPMSPRWIDKRRER